MSGDAEAGAVRLRTLGTILAALVAVGAGTTVAVAAPTFEAAPGSTRSTPATGTDASVPPAYQSVAAATLPGSAIGDAVVGTFAPSGNPNFPNQAVALVLRGGGTGADVFTSMTNALGLEGRSPDVALGDVDANGRNDIAITLLPSSAKDRAARGDTARMTVLRDTGAGFVAGPLVIGGGAPLLTDVTGDGRADLIAASGRTVIARPSNGDGSFPSRTDYASGPAAGVVQIAAGELTGDGRPDVVAAADQTATLYPGQSTGAPLGTGTPVTISNVPDEVVRNVAVGDVDGDGGQDIVALLTDMRISVTRHPPGSGFLPPVYAPRIDGPPDGRTALTLADVDLDGDADVITSGRDGRVKLSQSTGAGLLAPPVALATAGTNAGVAAADFDGDGRPDILHLARGTSLEEVRLLRNTTPIRPRVVAATVRSAEATKVVLSGSVKTVEPGAQLRVEYGVDRADQTGPTTSIPARQSAGRFDAELTGLTPGTAYVARVVAENAGGSDTADLTFTTADGGADTAIAVDGLPETVIAGQPQRPVVTLSGSAGPWRLVADWGRGGQEGPATELTTVSGRVPLPHAFTPAPPLDASVVARPGPRTAFRTVIFTAVDRAGRETTVSRLVTVKPNTAPVAVIGSGRSILEYGTGNLFASLSTDADAPLDAIASEQFRINAALRSDRGNPPVSSCAKTAPPAVSQQCLFGDPATLRDSPWENDLKALGRGPVGGLKLAAPDPAPYSAPTAQARFDANFAAMTKAAAVLRDSAEATCLICKAPPRPQRVALTVADRSGKADTAIRDFEVRTPNKPIADGEVTLNDGQPVDAIKQDSSPGADTGTKVTVDPSTSTVDGGGKPVWYLLEVGTPWQQVGKSKCFGAAKGVEPGIKGGATPTVEDFKQASSGYPGDGFGGALDLGGVNSPIQKVIQAAKSGYSPTGKPLEKQGNCAVQGSFGVKDETFAIVTKDPKQLTFRFPRAGNNSVLLTVFDRYGQSSAIRFDGFETLPASATCTPRDYQLGSGATALNVAGSCITFGFDAGGAAGKGDANKELAWTTGTLLLNGLAISPEEGSSLVLDGRDGPEHRVLYAAKGTPSITATKAWATKPEDTQQAAADLLIGGARAVRFRPDARCDGAKPTKLTPAASGAKAFCVDRIDDRVLPALSSARYKGLVIPENVTVKTLGAPVGRAQLDFVVELPRGFGPLDAKGQPTTPETGPVQLTGRLDRKALIIGKTNYFAARGRGGKRVGPTVATRRLVKLTPRQVMARAAQAGKGTGHLSVPAGSSLGGFPLPGGLSFDIDPETGSGTASGTIELGPVGSVPISVRITGGELASVTGGLDTSIPVGGGAFVTHLGFGIQTLPNVVLTGQVTVGHNLGAPAQDPALVQVVGTVEVTPSPFLLVVKGEAQLATIGLANAEVRVSAAQFAVAARVGAKLGPASISAGVAGDFGAYGFNIQGDAEVCLGFCRGATFLLSSRGAAACGTLDLLFTDVSFGVGVIYSPFDVDLYFSGCSVAAYRAQPGNSRAAENDALTGGIQPPGTTRSFTVTDDDLPSLQVVATAVAPGAAPRVTLTGPAGQPAATRSFTTPAELVNYTSATKDALVEADPAAGVTRFVVDRPRQGVWTVTTEGGSPPLAKVELGQGVPPATKALFKGTRTTNTTTELARAAMRAGKLQGIGLLGKPTTAKTFKAFKKVKNVAKGRAAARPPKTATPEKSPVVTKAALAKIAGSGAIGPSEVDTADLRRVVKLTVEVNGNPGDQITFAERGAGVAQQLGRYVVPGGGRLRADLMFEPARAASRKRVIDANVDDADGAPRGIILAVASFTADPIVAKNPPRILRVERQGTTRTLVFSDGPSYPRSYEAEWRLRGVGSLGTRLDRGISGNDLKPGAGGTWRYRLRGILPHEDFRRLRVVGLDAEARTTTRGAESTRTLGSTLRGGVRRPQPRKR